MHRVRGGEPSSKKNTEETYQLAKHMVFPQGTFKLHKVTEHLGSMVEYEETKDLLRRKGSFKLTEVVVLSLLQARKNDS